MVVGLKGHGAGDEREVFENATGEASVEWSLAGIAEVERRLIGGRGQLLTREEQGDVRKPQPWLIDNDRRRAGDVSESDLPWALSRSEMLDGAEGDDVEQQGDDKCDDEMFEGIIARWPVSVRRCGAHVTAPKSPDLF